MARDSRTIFGHRPALIGGMRIQVGSDVYDGSVRAGLAALEKKFLERGIYGGPITGNRSANRGREDGGRQSRTSASSARSATASPSSKA